MAPPRHLTRKQFLATLGLGALGAKLGFAAPAPEAGISPANWREVAGMFSFSSGIAPMNAANLCPSFDAVEAKVFEVTRNLNRDVSFNNRAKFAGIVQKARAALADYLNVGPGDVAFVRNTSEANSIINNGFPLGPGDQVLLWTENHTTNYLAWEKRQERFGFEIKRVELPWKTPPSKSAVVEFFRRQIEPGKTKLFTFTEVSNVSGLKLPAKELCEMAHEFDVFVHVDGAQSWGALDLDLADMGCDSFSASAHKWFCGPKEVGILYVKKEHAPKIWQYNFGYGAEPGATVDATDARRFETLGQRDDAALAGMAEAIRLHRAIGKRAVHDRVVFLADRLKQGLLKNGANLVTPESSEFSHGVVIVEVPEARRAEVANAMYEQYGIACAPTGGLRICPHIYNTEAQVDRAIAGVKALV